MPYVYQPYPAFRYSRTAMIIVKDADEDAALGPGWYDSPAKIPVCCEEEQTELKSDSPEPKRRGRPRRV
jgi:hypothetical protein